MSTHDANGVIIGGETPFMPASEAWRHFSPNHRPVRIEKDGKDETRLIFLGLCAMFWNGVHGIDDHDGQCAKMLGDYSRDDFMREFIAGSNTDLRALGLGPLISIGEVERLAPHLIRKAES